MTREEVISEFNAPYCLWILPQIAKFIQENYPDAWEGYIKYQYVPDCFEAVKAMVNTINPEEAQGYRHEKN